MKRVSFIEVCDLTMGQSPRSDSYNNEGRGLPFYQGNADFGKKTPVARVWCDAPKKRAYAGDILLSVRAPIGAINVTTEECCIGRGLAALKPHGGMTVPSICSIISDTFATIWRAKERGVPLWPWERRLFLSLSF